MQKNNTDNLTWQPSASISTLQRRSRIIKSVRDFFDARGVLEVETPLLCHTSVTDPFIQSMSVHVSTKNNPLCWLQTSPEYAMKRLLAAGSGTIYQITKAFRQEEIGKIHNPEFTLLEWYQLNYDHHDLMNEVDELLQYVLKTSSADRYTYHDVFKKILDIDIEKATCDTLAQCAAQQEIFVTNIDDKDTWLQLLMSHCIEPQIGKEKPCFIYDFPATQAALSRIQKTEPPVASRFEVYFKGMELANGFHELQDENEQRIRFEKNNLARERLQLPVMPLDNYFLSALNHGLPNCAGVALGMDRLIMLAIGANTIREVMSFDFDRA